MVEPHTTETVLLGTTDADTAWTPIALSGPIVGSRTGTGKSHGAAALLLVGSTPGAGKTHAMRALLLDALVEGGDRG